MSNFKFNQLLLNLFSLIILTKTEVQVLLQKTVEPNKDKVVQLSRALLECDAIISFYQINTHSNKNS